ncbi:aldehyde dehydrogenase family protein, partial [Agrococcus lahaulensis]
MSITEETTETTTVHHWIDGRPHESAGDRTAPVYDPALGVVTKHVSLADDADVRAAIASASAAFPAWRDLS